MVFSILPTGVVEEGSGREAVLAAALPGHEPGPLQRRRVAPGQQGGLGHEGCCVHAARINPVRRPRIYNFDVGSQKGLLSRSKQLSGSHRVPWFESRGLFTAPPLLMIHNLAPADVVTTLDGSTYPG